MEKTFRIFGELRGVLASGESRALLFDRSTSSNTAVRDETAAIIARVRAEGDDALRDLARRYDGVQLQQLEVPRERIDAALESTSRPLLKAMQRAAANIRTAHENSLPSATEVETEPGIIVGRRPDPLDTVGVYAPGGRAAYPSSVLMGAVPARCAGVREVILCSPPGQDGFPSAPVLAAAAIARVDRVFALGGAGAITAMALGTRTVPRAQRIVGPGNAWVAEAKLQLSGFASFDSPAGPSELLVIADDTADSRVIAREMLAQAEHDPAAAVVAVCVSQAQAEQVAQNIARLLASEPRAEVIRSSLRGRGAVLWTDSMQEALAFASQYAPEHLMLATANAEEQCAAIRNAGTIFLGEQSSVSFGDYMTGGNHVLPTGSLARSYSGLSTLDFVRWTTYQRVSKDAARSLAQDVATFAMAENLPAHAAAARAWGEQ